METLKIEIWSDIMCPFCYIGKRHLEQALAAFPEQKDLEIVWKSFQLDPTTAEDAGDRADVYEYLAQKKGLSTEASRKMHQQVNEMAQNAGLQYDFDHTYMTNSRKAHRLIQLAKTKGLGDAAEEALFRAYFTEGKNVSDPAVLETIAGHIGLDSEAVQEALSAPQYEAAMQADIREAAQIGVQGVPFFVFDRKYAISGAQPVAAFTQTLRQAHQEWQEQQRAQAISVQQGPACDTDGHCNI